MEEIYVVIYLRVHEFLLFALLDMIFSHYPYINQLLVFDRFNRGVYSLIFVTARETFFGISTCLPFNLLYDKCFRNPEIATSSVSPFQFQSVRLIWNSSIHGILFLPLSLSLLVKIYDNSIETCESIEIKYLPYEAKCK